MTRPNFLMIQADQLTSTVLSAYGNPLAKTPHMDALAAQGTVFQNSYCSYPLCGPSRMSMMTGRLASRIGAYDNGAELPSTIPTFAHYLRAAGYRTALSGKMHFVGADQLHGFEHRLTTDIYPGDFTWTENLETRDEKNRSDDRAVTSCGIAERTVQLDYDELAVFQAEQHLWDIARAPAQPFCLFVSLTHPHDPYYCQTEHWERYADTPIPLPTVGRMPSQARDPLTQYIFDRHALDKDFPDETVRRARRAYLGSVSYVDDQVGRLMGVLARAGLQDDTIVIILGDHGEMLGERGIWFKRHFYEWSARVPMIFAGPGVATAARAENVTLMDLAPTLMSLAGCADTAVEPMEGRDLSPALSGGTGPDDSAVSEVMSDGLAAPVFMVRRGAMKLIWGEEHPAQLYDITKDPNELQDLANDPAHVDILDALKSELLTIWDPADLRAQIDLSIARRLLIRRAHGVGTPPKWDYVATPDDQRWCRAGEDYTAWSTSILPPRGSDPRN
ncbi:MAG: choline-sulfatase [Pseudomonadota bacterium]